MTPRANEQQTQTPAPAEATSPATITSTIDRRRLLAGAGAAALGAGVARSGFAAPAVLRQETKTIPLFTTENDPDSLAFYERTIAGFQEEYPDVELEITLYQDENQVQYLTTAFETGTDLGIFAPPGGFITEWARAGDLLPITPIVEQIGTDDFLPGTRVVVDGEDYAMPFQSNASAVWIRQDLIEAEGLPLPTTFEEYLAIAATLHDKDGLIGLASATGSVPQMTRRVRLPAGGVGRRRGTTGAARPFRRPASATETPKVEPSPRAEKSASVTTEKATSASAAPPSRPRRPRRARDRARPARRR